MANPRKPTALKVLAGNPGKRPLPDSEPQFAAGDLEPPEWLMGEALALWPKYARGLDANGMLTDANRELLAAYCDLLGSYIESRKAGEAPDLKITQQIRLLGREFGFTPSSQAGVSAPGKGKKDSGKERFFA